MTDNVAERDRLCMAPAEELVSCGIIPHADYADALAPGPRWREEIAERAALERQRAALAALGELKAEDVAAILEALRA